MVLLERVYVSREKMLVEMGVADNVSTTLAHEDTFEDEFGGKKASRTRVLLATYAT